ncbi:MAG: GDP-mannose 4,6-dehydratase [Dysgonamonadaceae bacterium]|jgi:CDP-paratose 2-epimerase|nr:GDP-mannose 4,6-dehydratase [Dysgonamonadaceae bacterium]
MKKYVIIGGTGFVGSNLACHFKSKGMDVIAIDNLTKAVGTQENKKRIESAGVKFAHVDIRNWHDVEYFFRNEKEIDAILHVAAQVAFKKSVENPRLDFEINALGTFNLLEALRIYHPQAVFINTSTNQVYGEQKLIPVIEYEKRFDYADLKYGLPESFPLDFLSPYGCSKGAADQYTLDYARVYNLKTVSARLGGIYGDWQYSYEDHGWVAYMTQMVASNKSFNRFGHGKQVRDVLYVSDICSAFEHIITHIENARGEAINISGGYSNTLSVLELLDILEKITGNKEKSIENPMRKADKLVAYLDIRKAKKLIDWEPLVPKEEGIERLLKWTKQYI